ncbi:FAD/NAD(P)-binding protein [Halomonas elongata]|uniref:FAD/NAD(P)-binding protein n=1 Tax=Halomonas elongata TaxID=2746 RepID=UPI0038D49AF0
MFDVAVVGFGATGVSLLRQLHSHIYEQDIDDISIAIISPEESFSLGLAFGQAEPFHKVNTPPELMGIDPEDPSGFSSWMRKETAGIERFPSRKVYSSYLRHIYQTMGNDKKLDIHEYHSTATDMDTTQGNIKIQLQDGRTVFAKRAVLALGSITAPTFPPAEGISPILPKEISGMDVPETAFVAGTGLTAVDCVRSLVRAGCQEIHMFSRNGFAPTVISRSAEYSPEHFTWQNLKQELKEHQRGERLPHIIKLLRREIGRMRNPEVFQANRLLDQGNLSGYWDYLLKRSEQGDLPFQDTLSSTRYFSHKVWRKLGEGERLDFQRYFGAFWACWRHPIPVEVVQELNELAHMGRLKIHRPIAPLRKQDGDFLLETRQSIIRASALIDGTGGSSNVEKAASPLLQNMLARGLCKPHPCGGVRVDNLTYTLQNDLKEAGIYCLGPLAKGELFSTNAFWFNANCAANLAHLLAIQIRLDTHSETHT